MLSTVKLFLFKVPEKLCLPVRKPLHVSAGGEEMIRVFTLCGFRHPLEFGTCPLRMRGLL